MKGILLGASRPTTAETKAGTCNNLNYNDDDVAIALLSLVYREFAEYQAYASCGQTNKESNRSTDLNGGVLDYLWAPQNGCIDEIPLGLRNVYRAFKRGRVDMQRIRFVIRWF